METLYVSAKIEIHLFLGYKSICTCNLIPKYHFCQYHYSWQNTTINWTYIPRANLWYIDSLMIYWVLDRKWIVLVWCIVIDSQLLKYYFMDMMCIGGHQVFYNGHNTQTSLRCTNQYRFPIKQRIKADNSLPKRVLQFYALNITLWVNLGYRRPWPTQPATMVAQLHFPSPC